MKWAAAIAKLVLGVLLALMLLSLVGVAATRYFMARLTAPPPRPVFSNDAPAEPPSSSPEPEPSLSAPQDEAVPEEDGANAEEPLEPGAYQARVIQPIGLILRDTPAQDANQIGGIEYDQELIVLEESDDQRWLRVRLSDGQEGWVKAGNTERLN